MLGSTNSSGIKVSRLASNVVIKTSSQEHQKLLLLHTQNCIWMKVIFVILSDLPPFFSLNVHQCGIRSAVLWLLTNQ